MTEKEIKDVEEFEKWWRSLPPREKEQRREGMKYRKPIVKRIVQILKDILDDLGSFF